MALKDYSELNPIQLDVLREIGNIGTGNAATSLASMLAKDKGKKNFQGCLKSAFWILIR